MNANPVSKERLPMSGKNKPFVQMAPALGLVFGAGMGALLSLLCGFSVAIGLVFGAAAGLVVGAAAFGLSKRRNSDNKDNGHP
jgi:hypothetical protein